MDRCAHLKGVKESLLLIPLWENKAKRKRKPQSTKPSDIISVGGVVGGLFEEGRDKKTCM